MCYRQTRFKLLQFYASMDFAFISKPDHSPVAVNDKFNMINVRIIIRTVVSQNGLLAFSDLYTREQH